MAITSAPVTDDPARTREEELLARRAADGDGAAFATLYDRYERRIFNYCLRLLASSDDAADATQDAFLKVLQRLPKLGDRELNFSAYLYTAARNASYDMIGRRKKAEPVDEIPEPAGVGARELGAIDEDPERAALLDSLQAEVQDANARLPERQREVLAMRELQDMSYDEIAEIMDMNRNSVAQLISRARIKLRDELRGTALASIAASSADCERALPLISMRQDGQLSKAADREWLEAHVATCPTCKVSIEAIEEAGVSYRAWLPIVPLEFLRHATIAKASELVGADWSEIAEAGRTTTDSGGDHAEGSTVGAGSADASHPEVGANVSRAGLLHLPASWMRRGEHAAGEHAAGEDDAKKRRKRALVLGVLGAFLLLAGVTAVVTGSSNTAATDKPVGEQAAGASNAGGGDGSGTPAANGGDSAGAPGSSGTGGKGGKDGSGPLTAVPFLPGLKVKNDGTVVNTTTGRPVRRGRGGKKPGTTGGGTNNNSSNSGGGGSTNSGGGGSKKPSRTPSRTPSSNNGGGGSNKPSGGGNTTPSGGGGTTQTDPTPPSSDPPASDPPASDPPASDTPSNSGGGGSTNTPSLAPPPSTGGGGSTQRPSTPTRPPSTNGGSGSGSTTPPTRCPAGVRC